MYTNCLATGLTAGFGLKLLTSIRDIVFRGGL